MKKLLLLALSLAVLAGCSIIKPLPDDGLYLALSSYDKISEWREFVIIEISDGEIIDLYWDAVPFSGGELKTNRDEFELWTQETEMIANHILENQKLPKSTSLNSNGEFQLVEGSTIDSRNLVELCSLAVKSEPITKSNLSDGWYHFSEDVFADDGWLEWVDLTVANNVIVSACWNGANSDGGFDRYTREALENSNFALDLRFTETYILQNQSIDSLLPISEDGKSFKIPELNGSIEKYINMLISALEEHAISRGPYQDGNYNINENDFDQESGWASEINFLVNHGSISSININMNHIDGIETKRELSEDGTLGMVVWGGAKKEWHEQILILEKWFIDTQFKNKPDISEFGTTDEIAGVTIKIENYIDLTEEALANGPNNELW